MVKSRRDLEREMRALDRQEAKVIQEVKQLAKQGQNKAAKMMAKEIVRIRNQKQQLMKAKVTVGAVQSKVQSAKATMTVQKSLAGATSAMATANAVNSPTKMQQTMMQYEKQAMMMQTTDELLDELLEDSDGEEEAEELVNAVFDEIGLEMDAQMVSAPKGKIQAPKTKSKTAEEEDEDLEKMLAGL